MRDYKRVFWKAQRQADKLETVERDDVFDTRGYRKKQTSKWCKGKVGTKHDPVWVYGRSMLSTKIVDYRCTNCGKVIDSWFEFWDGEREGNARPEIGSREPRKK